MTQIASRWVLSLPGLLTLLGLSAFSALFIGAYDLAMVEIWEAFINYFSAAEQSVHAYLLFHIRLPRIILAGLIGAGLAISGAAIQGLFRNPLADPSLIGVTSGSMLFAVFSIVIGGAWMATLGLWFQTLSLSVFAFLGGLTTTYLVYALSRRGGETSIMTMLLAGIAISAFAAAISGLFINMSNDQQLRDITFWTLGSVSGASWPQVMIAAPIICIGSVILVSFSQAFNAILLGEKEAIYLGIEVEKVKSRVILLAALIVGVCISVSGLIGFIGLVIPHLIRLLKGTDYRYLLISSSLLGAIFMILADTIARTIIAPGELPIGILSAMVGAPFFLWILIKTQRQQFML
ncbi:MAG: iron ABC transporter permease [Bacteroidota bacterium]